MSCQFESDHPHQNTEDYMTVLERKKKNMKKLADAYTKAKKSGRICHVTSIPESWQSGRMQVVANH